MSAHGPRNFTNNLRKYRLENSCYIDFPLLLSLSLSLVCRDCISKRNLIFLSSERAREKETRKRETVMYSRRGFEKKKGKLVTASGIENSTTNDAGGFFVAVDRVRCMDVPVAEFRHPGDRMNSVNKKCALELAAPVRTQRGRSECTRTDVFSPRFPTNTNARPFPFCFLPPPPPRRSVLMSHVARIPWKTTFADRRRASFRC